MRNKAQQLQCNGVENIRCQRRIRLEKGQQICAKISQKIVEWIVRILVVKEDFAAEIFQSHLVFMLLVEVKS